MRRDSVLSADLKADGHSMDTTTASGQLLFHVFGALAQYE